MRRMARQKLVIYFISFVIGILIFRYITSRTVDWDSLVPSEDSERAHRNVAKHDKWIVVTSIQPPTDQVKQLADIKGWKLVVVGDRKSPDDWSLPGVIFLNTAAQKALNYRIHGLLPYDSYTRKAIGYLYAIEHGATFIYETDDDNEPYDGLSHFHTSHHDVPVGALVADTKNVTFNPYPHFGQSSMWPRGYPLEYVGNDQPRVYRACASGSIPAIQQGLVNGDPDVDAIFRLTRKHSSTTLDLKFDSTAPPVILPKGVFASYNSQNTLVTARAFWSLVLPTTVKGRACDIYRAYWAQRLMWLTGGASSAHVAYYPPTSYQRRNPHSSIVDAAEEAELYQHMGRYVKYLSTWKCKDVFFFDCARRLTEDLVVLGFLGRHDLALVDAWLTDLAMIGYLPPTLKQHPQICSSLPENAFLFYPWEQNTSMPYVHEAQQLPVLDRNLKDNINTVREVCGTSTAYQCSTMGKYNYDTGLNVLLVVTVYNTKDIPNLDAVYRLRFPTILYCGKQTDLVSLEHIHHVSYISPRGPVNAVNCMSRAITLGYNVQGYLHVSSSMFFNHQAISTWNLDWVWSMLDTQVYKPEILEQCNDKNFHCINLTPEKLSDLQHSLQSPDQSDEIKQCFKKIGQDENLKHKTGVKYLRDPAFFLPNRLLPMFKNVSGMLDITRDGPYSFLAYLLLDCMELVKENLSSSDVIVPFHFEALLSYTNSYFQKTYCDHINKVCV